MQPRPSKQRQQQEEDEPTSKPTKIHLRAASELADKDTDTDIDASRRVLLPKSVKNPLIVAICVLPLLATVVLFVRLYYERNNDDNVSRVSANLQTATVAATSSSSSFILSDQDANVRDIGELHPEDHVYRETITHTLDWSITAAYQRPDGVKKRIYLINGEFPGPKIEARSGDVLQIRVRNDLEEEQLSLHWHGLNMRGANTMDGVIGVTQCGIEPGESFWYNFTIPETQSGTFWYHAHSGVQRADGLYGSLIVHRPVPRKLPSSSRVRRLLAESHLVGEDGITEFIPDSVRYNYEKETVLMIGDWYHRTAGEVASWYLWWGSRGYEPVPDSLLVNGAGKFNCSNAVPARPLDCVKVDNEKSPSIFLDGESSYRVRVINTGSLTGITLGFPPETVVEIITLDGGLSVEMKQADVGKSAVGIIYPGQRVDFVLRPAKNRESWMAVKLDESDFKFGNPALVPQQIFPIVPSSAEISPLPTPAQDLVDLSNNNDNIIDVNNLFSTPSILATLPLQAQQTHLVYAKVEQLSRLENIPHGFFNRTTWKIQSDPPYPLLGLPREKWDKHQLAISTGEKDDVWVDLVVNNLDEGAHPFHLHGHNFYVIDIYESPPGSTRWGSYNPWTASSDGQTSTTTTTHPYDLSTAVLRDTVQVPRRGYAVLRFKADNPGVWLFHCHVMWHLAGGMAMLIEHGSSGSGENPHQPWLAVEGMECRV